MLSYLYYTNVTLFKITILSKISITSVNSRLHAGEEKTDKLEKDKGVLSLLKGLEMLRQETWRGF